MSHLESEALIYYIIYNILYKRYTNSSQVGLQATNTVALPAQNTVAIDQIVQSIKLSRFVVCLQWDLPDVMSF